MGSYNYDTSISSLSQFASHQQREKKSKQPTPFHSSLHSVRKPLQKPIGPGLSQQARSKIYNVDPVHFKELVQMLTADSSESRPNRLQEVAPPPLSLFPSDGKPLVSATTAGKFADAAGAVSPLGFNLSPSSLAFCSSFLLSPSGDL